MTTEPPSSPHFEGWIVVFAWDPGTATSPDDVARQLDGATIRTSEGVAAVSHQGKFLFVGGEGSPSKRRDVAELLSHLARRMKAGRIRRTKVAP